MARENFFSHTGPDSEHLLKGAFTQDLSYRVVEDLLKYNAPPARAVSREGWIE